jgi:hypothetical protein
MRIVNVAVHTVGVKGMKSASGDRYAREILYEKNFMCWKRGCEGKI